VPEVPAEHDPIWSRRSKLTGIELDLDTQLAFLDTQLTPYIAEFSPPEEPTGRDGDFYLRNLWYEDVDAEVLYAMVRHCRPKRILELGAGFSTLVSAAACLANERDGKPVELVSVDPQPRIALQGGVAGLARLERRGAEELPLERFVELEPGDILFVDTSHTVKTAGEVNYLVLDVLPALTPGVVVHFHDIFLPYEYPRVFLENGMFFSEQYLLQAYLSGNRAYEVVLAAHALARDRPDELGRMIPTFAKSPHGPSAFWLRRR
jgi:predicted O-methyltransferase YrrM